LEASSNPTRRRRATSTCRGRHPHHPKKLVTLTKVNTTPEALKKAAESELAIFDTLTQISTNILGGKAHK